MFPLWEKVIAPVLDAADARRIVEIGALRGETTEQMLERLGPDVELHVVDPLPEFDPSEHERRFPGRYVFHRDISHNVLPELPVVDAALIDGDHNWYTVYHELRMLRETARAAGAELPVLIMHDVLWPYGRRDLYYAPEQIPPEFRQPYAQRGMVPRSRTLLPEGKGGLSPQMNNALEEGGPRNGVMTALDDFIDEHDAPVRCVVIPIYFGLAIVAEEARLERQPELAAAFDRLESSEMRAELLELAESLRTKALIFQHGVFYRSEARYDESARRYLDVVKKALLNEHYFENEVRIHYLAECIEKGRPLDPIKLRDPSRQLQKETRRHQDALRSGEPAPDATAFFAYAPMGGTWLAHLERCLDRLREESVEGDLVECGTGRGGGAVFMRAHLEAFQTLRKHVWVADEFRAFPGDGPPSSVAGGAASLCSDLNLVREAFDRFDLLDDRVHFLQGPPGETLPDAPIGKIALLRIDGADPARIRTALDELYDRVTLGGIVVIDVHDDDEAAEATAAFRADRGVVEPLERVGSRTVTWRKLHAIEPVEHPNGVERPAVPRRAPLAPSTPTTSCDLSMIVVFYDMRREAERTLHSLSRCYQRDVEDLDYEVIVVDNGSAPDQALDPDFVRSFGPEFRHLDLGDEATTSPTNALNRGMELAGGSVIGMMIDGAHVLTPGLLHNAMLGLDTYAPAMAVAQQWYVGPGQQNDVMLNGYDQAREDELFEHIGWPRNGYRLFDIGHPVGERDWFDGVWESNCVLVPRHVLEQVGGMDDSFSMPGGGYANLEFYERIAATPGLTVVTMLGEGSFHQVHGGTTTNQSDVLERARRLASYGEHYTELRGRSFRGPGKPIHFVGALTDSARRTRARRMTAPTYFKPQDPDGGIPETPTAVPQDFRDECIDVFWRSLAWRRATWLGRPVERCPTDLFAYQEVLARVHPDWIVETGRGDGGRALFLASICDLLGHGHVISLGNDTDDEDLPRHDRLTNIVQHPLSPRTMRQVRDLTGEGPVHGMVVFGSRGTKRRTVNEFGVFSPLISVGSYGIVEDTAFNGHPVWPEFGLGPFEAVREIINTRRSEFAADLDVDRYLLSFNPGGFLKRIG